ncbi:hypothetical protein DPMN_107114 [Dreissena polymorpha]|uniref:Uncharacterized protein n=1 Tax=Dreissena polymorpha TaxID=45954 RepID=A0A9D4K665_DREPO|nr:hypothetical protein DPMN_107114 [Dreissena polymorpha]
MVTTVSRSMPDGIGQGIRPMSDHLAAAIRSLPGDNTGHSMTGKSPGNGPVRSPVHGTGHRSVVPGTGHQSVVPVTVDWSGYRSMEPGTGPVNGLLSTVTGHQGPVRSPGPSPVTGQYYQSPVITTGHSSPVTDRERDIDHLLQTIPPLLLLQMHLDLQLVLTIEVDVVHDLLYRVVLIHGVDMIDTDQLIRSMN